MTRLRFPRRWCGAFLLALLVGPGLAAQQGQAAATDSTVAVPRPIPLDSIPDRARMTASLVVGLPGRVVSDSIIARRDSLLRDLRTTYEADGALTSAERLEALFFDQLADLEGRSRQLQRRLTSWRDQTDVLAKRVQGVVDTLARLQERWRVTRATSWAEIPAAVREQVGIVQRGLDSTLASVRPLHERLLALQGTGAQLDVEITSRINELQAAQDRSRRQLFRQDSPALWRVFDRQAVDSSVVESAVASEAPDPFGAAVQYLESHPKLLRIHAVLLVLAILAFWLIGRRREAWATAEFALHWPSSLLAHPIAAGWLTGLVVARFLYTDAPQSVYGAAFLVVLPALLILVRELLGQPLRGPTYALIALYSVRVLADTFAWNPVVARFALLALAAGAVAVFLWFARVARPELATSTTRGRWRRFGGVIAYAGAGLESLAVLANVFGLVLLADLLITGALATALGALLLVALVDVVGGAVLVVLLATPVGRLQVIRRNRDLVSRRVAGLVHVAGFGVWLSIALRQFRLTQPAMALLTAVLGTPLDVGSWHFTAGDVLLFAFTLWLSIYLAGGLRALLREDLLARMDLDRGVPEAVASIVYYVVLALGFVFAAGAAGIDFSRLALIAGALGVGIGFGLQNIVANFISGLILLFERPIQTGDTLEMEGLRGTVQRIGIRASTVRTFQGADMIVPNQDLIAQRVINWTLSDQTRRVEIPIGVAYGSDPAQVISLVREVAEKHPQVQAHPAVEVLFTAFGESSLDFELRLWTRIDQWLEVRSDVLMAVYQAFAEHGIEIPFPQRDLHVRSVDPNVRGIGGGATES